MPETIDFFEACHPPRTTAQMKRQNRVTGSYFKSQAMESAEATFDAILINHRPTRPIDGPIGVQVTAYFYPPKDIAKKMGKGKLPAKVLKTTKPDLDNWVKMLLDRAKALGFIVEDANVCVLHVEKWLRLTPGVSVRIWQVEEGAE